MDTMNLWIDQQRENVLKVFSKVDIVFVNASEARQLSGHRSLHDAAKFILDTGSRYAVIKMGAAGAMLFGGEIPFMLPAYPLDKVVDPTGAGDTFASGMLGFLCGSDSNLDFQSMKKGLAYGSVNASFAVSGFGIERLREMVRDDIDAGMEFYLSTNQLGEYSI